MFRISRRSGFVAAAWLVASLSTVAKADTLVIPAANENLDGDSNLSFPFAVVTVPTPSNFPYQMEEVYGASEFGTPGDVIRITAARFRVDQVVENREPFSVQDLELRVGTSSKGPDELTSLASGSNIDDGDTTLVFAGPLSFDPCKADICVLPAFDIAIPFTTPFVYDPASGKNLILNFLNLSTSYPIKSFDAVDSSADGVSQVREVLDKNDITNHLFLNPTTVGLVTQFEFTVPEPGAIASIAASFVALVGLKRRRV